MDCHFSFDKHTSSICKSAYYHIRSLRHIRSAITDDMAKSVASSLVCSRLDYANSFLFGITQKNINRFQRVQNTLAKVVASHALPRGTHSFDILQDLHWLPIDQHIEFKLATLTYNILNSSQPAYLRSLLNNHIPTRSLRSANTNLSSVPRVRTTFASRGFTITAPQSGTYYPLASAVLPLQSLSVASVKLTASSRPTAPPSGSAKCLRFSHWLTLCTLNMHVRTYLITYLNV